MFIFITEEQDTRPSQDVSVLVVWLMVVCLLAIKGLLAVEGLLVEGLLRLLAVGLRVVERW